MDGRPNRRNKAAFSNFSGVEWTLPQGRCKRHNIVRRDHKSVMLKSHISSNIVLRNYYQKAAKSVPKFINYSSSLDQGNHDRGGVWIPDLNHRGFLAILFLPFPLIFSFD